MSNKFETNSRSIVFRKSLAEWLCLASLSHLSQPIVINANKMESTVHNLLRTILTKDSACMVSGDMRLVDGH